MTVAHKIPFLPPETEEQQAAHAREEMYCARRTALMLGCCPECWEVLRRLDGVWVCLKCRHEEEVARGVSDH